MKSASSLSRQQLVSDTTENEFCYYQIVAPEGVDLWITIYAVALLQVNETLGLIIL